MSFLRKWSLKEIVQPNRKKIKVDEVQAASYSNL